MNRFDLQKLSFSKVISDPSLRKYCSLNEQYPQEHANDEIQEFIYGRKVDGKVDVVLFSSYSGSDDFQHQVVSCSEEDYTLLEDLLLLHWGGYYFLPHEDPDKVVMHKCHEEDGGWEIIYAASEGRRLGDQNSPEILAAIQLHKDHLEQVRLEAEEEKKRAREEKKKEKELKELARLQKKYEKGSK